MTTEDTQQRPPPGSTRVYVLRIWHEAGAQAWRASMTAGEVSEKRYFASIDDCLEHLYAEFTRASFDHP